MITVLLEEDLILIAIVSCMIFIFLAKYRSGGHCWRKLSAVPCLASSDLQILSCRSLYLQCWHIGLRNAAEVKQQKGSYAFQYCSYVLNDLRNWLSEIFETATYSISDIFSRCASQHSGCGVIAGSLCYSVLLFHENGRDDPCNNCNSCMDHAQRKFYH